LTWLSGVWRKVGIHWGFATSSFLGEFTECSHQERAQQGWQWTSYRDFYECWLNAWMRGDEWLRESRRQTPLLMEHLCTTG
jgi:hypothetical protein